MQTTEAQQPAPPAAAGVRPAERIRGVDAARALAIIGMVMVHIGPRRGTFSGAAATAYGLTHGRASILFVLLAGVGVSILAGNRSPHRIRDARLRVLFRALLLFPLGLALQTLDTGVAVILQYYAMYFLVAVLALRLPDRQLAGLAGGLTVTGPLVMVSTLRWFPSWYDLGGAASIGEPTALAGALLLTGYYPVVTWAPPLLAGMWIGRLDLRASAVQWTLLATGMVVAAAAYGSAWVLGQALGPLTDTAEFAYLATAEGHSDMPLGIIGASAVAVAALGGALLVGARLPRLIWPVTATGQLALTVYVGHLLVLHAWPDLLVREDIGGAALSVARFTTVTVIAATLWRAVLPRGPLEAAFRAPWSLARYQSR